MKISGFFLAAFAAFALATAPVWAKDAPDGLTQVVSEAPSDSFGSSDPSLAMATASTGADSLANFGASSGTIVGNRALALRDEVAHLRDSVNLNSNEFAILRTSGTAGAVQYHSTVAAIIARLQNGTTKGNPILLRQWEEADACLGEVTSSLNKLNSLQIAVDSDASVASYLLGSIQAAFDLSGAVDEDYDQLKILHDEVSRLVVQLDYLRNQTTADIERQSNYLTTERANIQALAFAISRGEMLGNSLANRPVVVNPPPVVGIPNTQAPAPQAAPMSSVTGASLDEAAPPRETMQDNDIGVAPASGNFSIGNAPSVGHLLVLIRFNQPDVEYEQQLSQAVGMAMERRPDADFSIVAISPSSGDPATLAEQKQIAKRNADEVKRALVRLGLSPSHIALTHAESKTAQSPEVHIYIR